MRPRFHVRLGALAAALALAVLAVAGTGASTGVRAEGRLPACRYDDIMTRPQGYDDWATTLVDTILRVPKTYVPPDLVSVSQAGIAGHGKVRAIAIDDLRAMAEAAKAAGNGIGVESAYRSYQDQQSVFAGWVARYGYDQALRFSARPGHSEHQLGLAIDFRSDPGGPPFTGAWGKTRAGNWMSAHAWEYGFVRSYPAGKTSVTCYASEPWHFRYVGRDLAAAIHASGLTIREYLWAHHTTAVVPAVTPKPPKSPAASGARAASPSAGASESVIPSESAIPSETPSLEPTDEAPSSEPASPSDSGAPGSLLPAQSAEVSAPPLDPSPVADLDPAVAAGLAVVLGLVLVVTVLVLRRGRSGVGL